MTIEVSASRCCGEVTTTALPDEAIRQKEVVRRKYAAAATAQGCGCGCDPETSFVEEDYEAVEGYDPQADLGLGCGVPTEIADLRAGDTVLDLGSGAGIDAFIARSEVGESGRVIGVDFTLEMIDRARENATRLGYDNVSFVEGDIEALPLSDASVDVIISNCVLNLVPDKEKAFAEMRRVLRPGGRFCISDIVLEGALPERLRASAEAYAGCVSGAVPRTTYLDLLRTAGFANVQVRRARRIDVPDSLLAEVEASAEEVAAFSAGGGIASVTVTGERAV